LKTRSKLAYSRFFTARPFLLTAGREQVGRGAARHPPGRGFVKAIISDIHSNFEALQAVLKDIEGHPVTEIYCLGDVVGYGPNPRECVDLVMKCKMVLLGNHDQGAMFDPDGFNPPAERAIFWTRDQLESSAESRQAREKRWEFLAERPRSHRENGYLYVHGSARNPLNEYVFPEDIYNQRKMERIFALVERYCFQGHTHVPGIFTEQLPDDLYQFSSPEEIDYAHKLDGRKTLCNVGSVGQPRDGDPRACYVLLDGDTIRYRRVEYDVEATIKKIYAIPELENFLGDRLRDGR
jgi:diadenosine tetraphosphatase ApaH/serine/threonine PP2A family protein phosphatase